MTKSAHEYEAEAERILERYFNDAENRNKREIQEALQDELMVEAIRLVSFKKLIARLKAANAMQGHLEKKGMAPDSILDENLNLKDKTNQANLMEYAVLAGLDTVAIEFAQLGAKSDRVDNIVDTFGGAGNEEYQYRLGKAKKNYNEGSEFYGQVMSTREKPKSFLRKAWDFVKKYKKGFLWGALCIGCIVGAVFTGGATAALFVGIACTAGAASFTSFGSTQSTYIDRGITALNSRVGHEGDILRTSISEYQRQLNHQTAAFKTKVQAANEADSIEPTPRTATPSEKAFTPRKRQTLLSGYKTSPKQVTSEFETSHRIQGAKWVGLYESFSIGGRFNVSVSAPTSDQFVFKQDGRKMAEVIREKDMTRFVPASRNGKIEPNAFKIASQAAKRFAEEATEECEFIIKLPVHYKDTNQMKIDAKANQILKLLEEAQSNGLFPQLNEHALDVVNRSETARLKYESLLAAEAMPVLTSK